MERICRRPACRHDFSRKYRLGCLKSWEDHAASGSLRGQRLRRHLSKFIMPTKMKIRAARIGRHAIRSALRLILDDASIPSTTSRNFLPHGERNSTSRKPWWKSLKARRVLSPARKCGIPSTAKERCTIEKVRVKKPRLRYNSLASV